MNNASNKRLPQAIGVTLLRITQADLQALAQSCTPGTVLGRSLEGALPPDFVARRTLEHMPQGRATGWCSTYYAVRDADQVVVGSCGFKGLPMNRRVEIGYGVSPACRNQGVATQAVRALLDLAFASTEIDEVLAQVNPDNRSSTRVVEKLAFLRIGQQVGKDNEPLVQWVATRAA